MNGVIRFLKDWTLPVAIVTGTLVYLAFYSIDALDAAGDALRPFIETIFPVSVFLTLFVTFCKVDFHQMMPHRWHAGVLVAQLLLVAVNVAVIVYATRSADQRLLWEAVLTCIIGPAASASPVVTVKLGGNISTMTAYVLMSSFASALLIPIVFPLLEGSAGLTFIESFLVILQKVAMVLLLPLLLGWLVQHYAKTLCARISAMPNLSFYLWGCSLCITTGITVKNIVHSQAPLTLLLMIAALTLLLCFAQFGIGRLIGRHLGEEINSGQALFQKNTALSIWVAYMYLHPVASIGAGCYVLWQNIINSMELWHYKTHHNNN